MVVSHGPLFVSLCSLHYLILPPFPKHAPHLSQLLASGDCPSLDPDQYMERTEYGQLTLKQGWKALVQWNRLDKLADGNSNLPLWRVGLVVPLV